MKRLCFLAVLMALAFFGPCRPFDFIQPRQTSGAHRIRQALPFVIVRLGIDLQTPQLAPQA